MNRFSAKGGSASGGKKLLIPLFIAVFDFGLAHFALADLENPLGSTTTFAALIEKVAKIVAQIGLPVAALAIIYAGFLFVTAGGNEEKVTKARKTFLWSIIGTALLLGAWAIASAISGLFTTTT